MILQKMRSCLWKLEPRFWTYGCIRLLGPSGSNVVSRPQAQGQKFFWDFMILLGSFHISWGNESCLWKLEPGFWPCGWICLLGPSGPNVVSRPQAPRSRHFLRFHDFIGFTSWLLRKWGPVFLKIGARVLDLWLDWICLLDPSGPNVVSRPQVPRSRHYLRFHDFIGFTSWSLRKWGLACENWSYCSWLMAW